MDISFEIKVYWCEVSLDTRRAWEEIDVAWQDSHNREWIRYDDKVIAQGEAGMLYVESGLGGALYMIWKGDLLGPSHLGGPSPSFINGACKQLKKISGAKWN